MPARKRSSPHATTRSARVTTRTGDGGETSLFGKGRVRKTDPRIVALGDLDEAQSAIGVARAMAPRSTMGRQLLELQRGLYIAMSEVATPREDLARLKTRLDDAALAKVDSALEWLKARTPIEGRFVIPGESPISAALDQARTVARRAERSVVACVDAGTVSGGVLLPWLNRLSDLLFVLARTVEKSRPGARR
ncbi:MAG TPA: cob(I)yrinic acid a,c-diamide adenosyltransferase [Candidatus Limnocylindria bacterium]